MWDDLDRVVEYEGVVYKVVMQMDNYLLLVIPQEDVDNGRFPSQAVVIPDLERK